MTKLLAEITEKNFPDEGILWRGWNDDTLRIIQEKNRPVLLFVADVDPFVSPFLREIFKAMPANARLRDLLNDFYLAMFIEADSIPPDLKALGAGSHYHIAVLSPHGLTPRVIFEAERRPDEVVDTIVSPPWHSASFSALSSSSPRASSLPGPVPLPRRLTATSPHRSTSARPTNSNTR